MVSRVSRSSITIATINLVEQIREYSRSHKESWRKIPFLALQADGRDGFSDKYCRAYKEGLWSIESSTVNGHYTVFIDLADGELIRPSSVIPFRWNEEVESRRLQRKPAWDYHVLNLGYAIEVLYAPRIVNSLDELAKKKVSKLISKKQKNWRVDLQQKLKLEKMYTRR